MSATSFAPRFIIHFLYIIDNSCELPVSSFQPITVHLMSPQFHTRRFKMEHNGRSQFHNILAMLASKPLVSGK
jgi:hypothetical protein